MVLWVFDGDMVGKWTNEPCNGVDEVVNPFWVLTFTQDLIISNLLVTYFSAHELYEVRLTAYQQHYIEKSNLHLL